MPGKFSVQWQQLTNMLGFNGNNFNKSRLQFIRETQMARDEDPCFGSELRYYCVEWCEWRRECRNHPPAG